MTNEQLFQDLKQYLDGKLGSIETDLAALRQEVKVVDEKFDTVVDAISEAHQTAERRLDNHEHRLTRLERHAA